jgi:hypothetical protein
VARDWGDAIRESEKGRRDFAGAIGRKKRAAGGVEILPSWGAAVLRPYMSVERLLVDEFVGVFDGGDFFGGEGF